jgi:ABC-type sulfate/molybdate transport systems ATPase subunit
MATAAACQPDETALDLFAQLRARARPVSAGVRIIDAAVPEGLSAGDVVEITGASGSGKSMMLRCTGA